ncbi:MAG: hypothetical protein AMJ65_08220 [Phycisphaerae bacterium SG8_4]|nr:MAG: hypothetical protein AMJ65_08220 [Phycisphaerae bacterium SG8_4]
MSKDEHKSDENASKPMYVSKEGFEVVPLRRGFDVIRPLWAVLEEVKFETSHDCFICGGYARWCASPRKKPIEAGDVDVYCETPETVEVLQSKLQAAGLEVRHENNISLTYEGPEDGDFAYMPPIQVIKPMREAKIVSYGDKKTVLENFDFTVIRAAILSPAEVMVDADFMHDEEHTLLRLKNIHCPVSSTLRCMKYSRKGYWLRPFEALRLFMDWDERDDEYRRTLIDFLQKAQGNDGLTKEEVDELEAMMRID